MELVTAALRIGQFPSPMIIFKHSVNGGSNVSSNRNSITNSLQLPKRTQLNHSSLKKNWPHFFRTSETPSHQSPSICPSYRTNPSDFIFFILSCYLPRTPTQILLYFFNKEYLQVLFLRLNQQVFGHPILNHSLISQISKSVKKIGAVQTKTLPSPPCSFKMRSTMDSLRRSQICDQPKLVGLWALPLANSE